MFLWCLNQSKLKQKHFLSISIRHHSKHMWTIQNRDIIYIYTTHKCEAVYFISISIPRLFRFCTILAQCFVQCLFSIQFKYNYTLHSIIQFEQWIPVIPFKFHYDLTIQSRHFSTKVFSLIIFSLNKETNYTKTTLFIQPYYSTQTIFEIL